MDYSEGQQVARRRESGVDRIGPYSLIAQIAGGDFTTVHLAQRRGTLGYQRLTAIKRLRPALARQPEWTQLLLDEARLSAGVRHPNIVDIIDVGNDPTTGVYLVMGYVEGADLEVLIARAGKERHPRYLVPPIVDALHGLSAVHTALDELGESLSMVHQAPRARHILIGIDGTARITDFSQVSARGLIPSTLRGKRLAAGYMAPEQVSVSEPVSARTDLFIIGITLWETLTGERLFDAENPALARRAILERHIPRPSEVGLRPPACFDAICMKALQRNPEQRYQTALEMARELREAAVSESLYASASELGQWVRALASRALVERRRALGAEEPSQEISLEELDGREPTSVINTGTSASAVPIQDAPANSGSGTEKPRPSAATAASAAEAIARGVSKAGAPPNATGILIETRVGLPSRAEEAGSSTLSAPTGEPRAAQSPAEGPLASSEPVARVHDAESAAVVQAITMDPSPLADDPSRVARSITVPVYGPSSAPRPAPVGLPAPTGTLLGVSARSPAAGLPGLGATRRHVTPSMSPASAAGAGSLLTMPSKRTSMPTASYVGSPFGEPHSGPATSARSASAGPSPLHAGAEEAGASTSRASTSEAVAAQRALRKLSASATLPEGTLLGAYLPPDLGRDAAQPEGPGTPGFTGFGYSAPSAGAEFAQDELFPAPVTERLASVQARVGAAGLDARAHGEQPRASTGYRDPLSEPQRTFDGELPADIFARLQAARREASESFRPPAYAVEDQEERETESQRGFGFKSLLVAAAIAAAGVLGYRHWNDERPPVRSAVAPVSQGEPAQGAGLPSAEPPPSSRSFEDLPGVTPLPSALAAPVRPGTDVNPRGEPAAQRPEVVPPPYAGEVPPPFVAPVEAPEGAAEPAPRRLAAARRAPRAPTSLLHEPQPSSRPLPRPRAAHAGDPALPDNPY